MRIAVLSTAAALVALSTLTYGQTAPMPPGRFVAIGCVTKQGTGTAARYLLTDRRGETATTYRLQGDAAQLEPHVGHTVEAAGPLTPPTAGSRQYVLKVSSLTWIASTCKR
jgi:hypothetical protein